MSTSSRKLTDYFSSSSSPDAKKEKKGGGSGTRPTKESPRTRLRTVAAQTLEAIENGHYTANGTRHNLSNPVKDCIARTSFFDPDSFLKNWNTNLPPQTLSTTTTSLPPKTRISVLEISTVSAIRLLWDTRQANSSKKIGVLNFASAKKEGGGFINGAQAQEESIARTSTIYPSLKCNEAQRFYRKHKSDNGKGFYSHSMIYSPDVHVIRDDDYDVAEWRPPAIVDILTSPAVNVGVAMRGKRDDEVSRIAGIQQIAVAMRERMARILYLFEHKGVDTVVLGSFGTGVFKNDVPTVAGIWKELLAPGGRFAHSFRLVVFAVIGHETFQHFKVILGPLEEASGS